MIRIKRWVEPPFCIGYWTDARGNITHAIDEGRAELEDGRITLAWEVRHIGSLLPNTGYFAQKSLTSFYYAEKSRIDKKSGEETNADSD